VISYIKMLSEESNPKTKPAHHVSKNENPLHPLHGIFILCDNETYAKPRGEPWYQAGASIVMQEDNGIGFYKC